MNLDVVQEGVAFRLRPVTVDDAEFIVTLRKDNERTRFLHTISPSVADQRRWIESYLTRDDDYYFIIERRESNEPVGTLGLYNVDNRKTRSAEWGRWILLPSSMGAVESAFLLYQLAFDRLGLESVSCRTAINNTKVISFHEACGLAMQDGPTTYAHLADGRHELVEQVMTRDLWHANRERLQRRVTMLAELLTR